MPPSDKKVTATEVSQKRYFKLREILESGILGPVAVATISGGIAIILTNSGEVALKVIGGVYFVSVWLNKRIKAARKSQEK